MTNMNRFSGLKHIFIFQQSSKIKQKAQKHKRYVEVNCAIQPSNLAKNLYSITVIQRKTCLTFFFITTTAIAFNNNHIVSKQENLVRKLAALTNNLAK